MLLGLSLFFKSTVKRAFEIPPTVFELRYSILLNTGLVSAASVNVCELVVKALLYNKNEVDPDSPESTLGMLYLTAILLTEKLVSVPILALKQQTENDVVFEVVRHDLLVPSTPFGVKAAPSTAPQALEYIVSGELIEQRVVPSTLAALYVTIKGELLAIVRAATDVMVLLIAKLSK